MKTNHRALGAANPAATTSSSSPHASSIYHPTMPPPELTEGLGGLCRAHGWSYGALWLPHRGDPRMLVMDECFYEEEVRALIDRMRNQVHTVGEGTVGAAVVSGRHQWIYHDNCSTDPTLTGAGDNLDMSQGDADLRCQFFHGIKTIAIVSVQSVGIVQFGSSQKISESLKFVNQVHYIFRQLKTVVGLFQNVDAQKAMKVPDPHAAFASILSSGDTCSSNNSFSMLHESICKVLPANAKSSKDLIKPSTLFSHEFDDGPTNHGGSMNHRVLPRPVVTHSTDMWAKEITTLPMLDQRLLSGMILPPSMLPEKSHFSFPHANMFHQSGDSSESCSHYISQGGFSIDDPFAKELSFASELPDNIFNSPQDYTLGHSQAFHSKDDPDNDLIHLGDQPLSHLNGVLTLSVNDGLSTSCASSVFVGGDSASCARTATSKQVENYSTCDMNSLNKTSDLNAKSSGLSDLLQSDNYLFDGLELDPNPRILGYDNWGDIVLPLGEGRCPSLTTSISEEINMCSTEGPDKGFFPESTLEQQLLDVVVAGNVKISSSYTSAPTTATSVAGLDSELQLSKTTKPGVPQEYRNEVSLVDPSSIRTSDVSLTECSSGKIMQGSPRKAFPKSNVSSWIRGSCSMNAESSTINQPSKPEETTKVARKRARPGESTRPRPKDRQQIQDRVKELREIVPNSTKCSIDSLLDRTIKHMLFLQSVTKYADKLRQADEPKMIGDKIGVVLKDHLRSGGGSTWAYEVAGQTMICPILVEDLNPPGQMLVEILCEDRWLFHEIADIIRGFGLTILKGVMEFRNSNIWARFLVEACRDVTRMEIFLSLIQLLQ